MYRRRTRYKQQDEQHLNRWLVSYADFMTLLFALFVVLYAMSIIKEEQYSVLVQSLSRVFDKPTKSETGLTGKGLLTDNGPQSELVLYGSSLEQAKGPTLLADASTLSEIDEQKLGSPLQSVEQHLAKALDSLIEQGLTKIQRDENWLTIELNSGLLFASGSATATDSATTLLTEITKIINPIDNYIRVRGYTDNRPINNELFASNWQLSASRAASVLSVLEQLGTTPARMAIEGFGQYYPFASNNTAQGRAENRKVVIAISRYGYEQEVEPQLSNVEETELQETLEQITQDDGSIKIIALPSGGIRITTRQLSVHEQGQ
jgi:chemotaxis protein MotB